MARISRLPFMLQRGQTRLVSVKSVPKLLPQLVIKRIVKSDSLSWLSFLVGGSADLANESKRCLRFSLLLDRSIIFLRLAERFLSNEEHNRHSFRL